MGAARQDAEGGEDVRQVRCRNCGAIIELPDFHGPKLVECPQCRWQEVYPARRRLPRELAKLAGAAYEARDHREPLSEEAFEKICEMSPADFEQLCADLFEHLGYVVAPAGREYDSGRDLELTQGTETTFVECKRYAEHHRVGRLEVEALLGAMQHEGVKKGIIITTSSFAEECRSPAEEAGVELVDGGQLRQMIESLPADSLRKWWE